MPRIAIDCRFAALHVGLGRYTRELVCAMLAYPGDLDFVLIVRSRGESWIPHGAECIEADISHYSFREQTELPAIIRKTECDLLFSPHFNVPYLCPVPFVVTIHDLILHRYPNNASWLKRIAYHLLIDRAVRRAQTVIAVSAFTAQEVADVYGSSVAKKTVTITEGVDESYVPASPDDIHRVRSAYAIQKPYFLYVGNAKQHKNVRLLIQAFVAAQCSDMELILVSGGAEFNALMPLPPHVRQLTDVSDADLPVLYSGAAAFVTASLYEGYCLPVAEALACACPVIATDHPVIAETSAGHAMLIEPTIETFAEAFRNPPSDRRRYVSGTWDEAARQTIAALYQSLQ